MALLNRNIFRITQTGLCIKGTFKKASFMFVTNVVEIYENPWSKNFINKSCHKYPKIIN